MYIYKVKNVIFEHYSILMLWKLFRQKKTDVPHQVDIACSFCRANQLIRFMPYNWIVQPVKFLSAIFLYWQMITLKKLRKILFISFQTLFFVLKIY